MTSTGNIEKRTALRPLGIIAENSQINVARCIETRNAVIRLGITDDISPMGFYNFYFLLGDMVTIDDQY
jgi:hypothetical protein